MNKNLTEIIFLLDRSGSMEGLEQDTIGGFNAFIKKQCQHKGETLLTVVLFDDEFEMIWNGVDASSNQVRLTEDHYFVRGSTALLDAVGKTILNVKNRIQKAKKEKRPGKVIFVITTDGMENASCEFTYEKVQTLIKKQQQQANWEFVFLGANINAAEEAGSLGIDAEHAYQFESTQKGVECMYDLVSETVSEKRGTSF